MISYGANLGLMVNAATGEVHDVALRGFLRGVDGLVQPNVKGYLTNTPPGSPSDGDVYIIGAAPTGAWAGNAGEVTRWYANDGAWDFYTPKNGWMFQSNSARESYRYTGSAWEIFYQEGTWTPVLGALVADGSHTYSTNFGDYILIGKKATARFRIVLSAKDPAMSGSCVVRGLPFTSRNTSGSNSGAVVGRWNNIALSAGRTMLVLDLAPDATKISILQAGSGALLATVTDTSFNNTSELIGQVVFFT